MPILASKSSPFLKLFFGTNFARENLDFAAKNKGKVGRCSAAELTQRSNFEAELRE